MSRLVTVRGAVLGLLFLLTVVVWWPAATAAGPAGKYLTVRFLDVGQGDAIHIETPDGFEMLIDGGPSASVLREFSRGRSFFDHSIDVVVATHPDTDHIAGLVDILKRYEVETIIETAAEHDAPAARAFEEAADAAGAHRITAQAGQTFLLGASTTVRILSPAGDTTDWESNVASVVVQVVYGDTEFMLTGDASSGIEEYLVDTYGTRLESEVLKLGHHGSKTSSSEIFLKNVQPQFAIVSAGKDNRYGHPHEDVVGRTSAAGAQIVSTAEQGTIIFQTDGNQIWLK